MDGTEVERIKRESRRLRGTLAESLADRASGALAEADQVILKFHGSYQQDDRDRREARQAAFLEPAYQFMIRTRTPGGALSSAQWLALDAIAERFANGTLRLTTRQAVQLHGVLKEDLKPAMQALLREARLDTIAACGDVNRTISVSACPEAGALHREVLALAARLSEALLPRSRAYLEIWLDGERLADSGEEEEPIYGPSYLPRKFKIAFAIPPRNDVEVRAQDLGFVAIAAEGQLQGFTVTVGGGMGMSAGDPRTYPRLAVDLGFVAPEQVIPLAAAVLTVQRDFGERRERKRARLKYTLETMGLKAFRAEVERRAGFVLAPPRPFGFAGSGDAFGWIREPEGAWSLGLWVPGGRVADRAEARFRSGLRAIAERHAGGFLLTPNQNLIVRGVAPGEREGIAALVREHGLDLHERLRPLRREAVACVALPSCPLAMAEAERALPELGARLERLLERHGLAEVPIGFRISGCPNGCSRPYLAEIAFVGRAPGRYDLRLGGDRRGERLNDLAGENLEVEEIFARLDRLLARYASERRAGEPFGDFVRRAWVLPAAAPLEEPTP
ncbi:MAG: NADPH-dependent assimilatory sulfite reductase hemoprotein subunit [Xanthomonadales bacterium]|nr:NADPH-dependent assimilatory sulfite reductase hemoprotein subunit [Xanthomonadales bacterium]